MQYAREAPLVELKTICGKQSSFQLVLGLVKLQKRGSLIQNTERWRLGLDKTYKIITVVDAVAKYHTDDRNNN